MKKVSLWMLSILFSALIVTSCSKKEEEPIQPFLESYELAMYLESTNSPLGKFYVNTDMPSIIKASDVKVLNETGQIYIIDVRKAADYALGHIENAVNVPLGDLLTHIQGMDLTPYEKVAVVCYSGQSAAYGTSLVRLMGYGNVYSMKWGMCSWNTFFANKWLNAIANGNAYASQFTATPADKGPEYEMPLLFTGQTTAQGVLNVRVADLFAAGFGEGYVSNKTVFDNLNSYYVVNYWKEAHYLDPGHIPGAMQYTPKASMGLLEYITTLPTDKPVVVYCYSGQTSAFLTAYLRLLGYDCKSLGYGANGMIYDKMVAAGLGVFSDAQIMEYPYVTK